MEQKNIDFEIEALKLKSLLTIVSGFDPDNKNAMYEVIKVVKMANDIAEELYCAIADRRLK